MGHFDNFSGCFRVFRFGLLVTSLPNAQEISDSIPSSAVGLFLVENYSTTFSDWAFVCFSVFCISFVLCFLLHSADKVMGDMPVFFVYLHVVQSSFFHYLLLAFKIPSENED